MSSVERDIDALCATLRRLRTPDDSGAAVLHGAAARVRAGDPGLDVGALPGDVGGGTVRRSLRWRALAALVVVVVGIQPWQISQDEVERPTPVLAFGDDPPRGDDEAQHLSAQLPTRATAPMPSQRLSEREPAFVPDEEGADRRVKRVRNPKARRAAEPNAGSAARSADNASDRSSMNAPAVRPAPATAASPDGPADDMDAELRLIRAIQIALSHGRPTEALASVEEHAARHANGVFREEREVQRAIALCALGRETEARAAAQRLLKQRPAASYVRRLASICSDQPPRAQR